MKSIGDNAADELAKKQLSSSICQKLLENGSLTEENLLPRKHPIMEDDRSFDETDKGIEGTRKNRAFYQRKVRKYKI